jgi:glyoxylase-like metal-dependent hydrolase (beta-lactamase superfamily II)
VRCETRFIRAGACRHPEAATLLGASWRPAVFPALAGLIRHPTRGAVLFDTGYDPAFFAATESFPERLYRWATPVTLGPGETAAEQLARHGLRPEDIAWVVLSHFHGDHAAGLHAFPAARIACARAGLQAVRQGGAFTAVRRGFLRGLLPDDLDARADFFEDCSRVSLPAEMAPFEDGADLFGDGSLIAVELPGHCPGHWGLLLRGADDRLNFLVGDAAWSSRAIRENRPPPGLTTALLGETRTYRQTLARLHALRQANPDLVITPAHCLERAAEADADDR